MSKFLNVFRMWVILFLIIIVTDAIWGTVDAYSWKVAIRVFAVAVITGWSVYRLATYEKGE